MKSTRITVSLADKEHAELTALAERYDVSLSWLTRKAITAFLDQHRDETFALSLDLPTVKRQDVK